MLNKEIAVEIQYGIGGGLIYVMATWVLYMSGLDYFLNPLLRFITFMLVIFLSVYAGYLKRVRQNNEISFIEAAWSIFITFFLIELIWNSFNYILFNYIDPGLNDHIRQFMIEYRQNAEDGRIDQEILETLEGEENYVTLLTAVQSLIDYSILGVIIALIGGALLKKEKQSGLRTME